MVKAAIFDLDGTLLDTLEDLANACNYALKKLGYNTHEIKEYVKFVGNGRYVLIQRIVPQEFKDDEEVISKALELFDKYYAEHMIDMTKPYHGIMDTLSVLKNMGIKLAVVSNKPHEFAEKVVKKYFGSIFEIAYGQREGHPTKPNPKTVYEVMNVLGVSKEQCIYIGDSDVDMHTARNSGTKSIGVSWGFRGAEELKEAGADFVIDKPGEIVKVILNN